MAHLTKQRFTVYVDRKGNRVEKGTPGAKPKTRESKKWYAANVPGVKKGKRIPLSADKRTAERMLARLVEKGELGHDAATVRQSAGLSLESLVIEFEAAVGRESGATHTRSVVTDVRRVLAACQLETLADLRGPGVAARVEQWVKSLTDGDYGITSATAAYIGKHARQFTRWLWRKRELLDRDPLAGVDLPSQETTNKRVVVQFDPPPVPEFYLTRHASSLHATCWLNSIKRERPTDPRSKT